MIEYSIIIPVLDSHEVVRRQLLHFARLLKDRPNWELIIVDDGSSPPLTKKSPMIRGHNSPMIVTNYGDEEGNRIKLLNTYDYRPWTQPKARNLGATTAYGDWFLFTDIDHILTERVLYKADQAAKVSNDAHYLLKFRREFGMLDKDGSIITEHVKHYPHPNTFLIDRKTFFELNGYDEYFCGRHGGDDTDFLHRFNQLEGATEALSPEHVYLIPEYAATFHELERE